MYVKNKTLFTITSGSTCLVHFNERKQKLFHSFYYFEENIFNFTFTFTFTIVTNKEFQLNLWQKGSQLYILVNFFKKLFKKIVFIDLYSKSQFFFSPFFIIRNFNRKFLIEQNCCIECCWQWQCCVLFANEL